MGELVFKTKYRPWKNLYVYGKVDTYYTAFRYTYSSKLNRFYLYWMVKTHPQARNVLSERQISSYEIVQMAKVIEQVNELKNEKQWEWWKPLITDKWKKIIQQKNQNKEKKE